MIRKSVLSEFLSYSYQIGNYILDSFWFPGGKTTSDVLMVRLEGNWLLFFPDDPSKCRIYLGAQKNVQPWVNGTVSVSKPKTHKADNRLYM